MHNPAKGHKVIYSIKAIYGTTTHGGKGSTLARVNCVEEEERNWTTTNDNFEYANTDSAT